MFVVSDTPEYWCRPVAAPASEDFAIRKHDNAIGFDTVLIEVFGHTCGVGTPTAFRFGRFS